MLFSEYEVVRLYKDHIRGIAYELNEYGNRKDQKEYKNCNDFT